MWQGGGAHAQQNLMNMRAATYFLMNVVQHIDDVHEDVKAEAARGLMRLAYINLEAFGEFNGVYSLRDRIAHVRRGAKAEIFDIYMPLVVAELLVQGVNTPQALEAKLKELLPTEEEQQSKRKNKRFDYKALLASLKEAKEQFPLPEKPSPLLQVRTVKKSLQKVEANSAGMFAEKSMPIIHPKKDLTLAEQSSARDRSKGSMEEVFKQFGEYHGDPMPDIDAENVFREMQKPGKLARTGHIIKGQAHTAALLTILGMSGSVAEKFWDWYEYGDPNAYYDGVEEVQQILVNTAGGTDLWMQVASSRVFHGVVINGSVGIAEKSTQKLFGKSLGLKRSMATHFFTKHLVGFVGFYGWEFGRELHYATIREMRRRNLVPPKSVFTEEAGASIFKGAISTYMKKNDHTPESEDSVRAHDTELSGLILKNAVYYFFKGDLEHVGDNLALIPNYLACMTAAFFKEFSTIAKLSFRSWLTTDLVSTYFIMHYGSAAGRTSFARSLTSGLGKAAGVGRFLVSTTAIIALCVLQETPWGKRFLHWAQTVAINRPLLENISDGAMYKNLHMFSMGHQQNIDRQEFTVKGAKKYLEKHQDWREWNLSSPLKSLVHYLDTFYKPLSRYYDASG